MKKTLRTEEPSFVDMNQLNHLHRNQHKQRINLALRQMQPLWRQAEAIGLPFRVELCHICHAPEGEKTPPHVHPYLEWTIVRQGQLQCRIQEHELTLQEGESLLTPPGVLHWRASANQDCELFGLMLSIDEKSSRGTRRLQAVREACARLGYTIGPDHRLSYLLEAVLHEAGQTMTGSENDPQGNDLMVTGYIVSMLGLLWNRLQVPANHAAAGSAVKQLDHSAQSLCAQAKAYLQANLSFCPSVDRTAEFIGISRRHLGRLFRECLGTTVSDCLDEMRIEQAKLLLSTTDQTIKNIAALSGFGSNTSYFCRIFLARTGVTPMRYRNGKSN